MARGWVKFQGEGRKFPMDREHNVMLVARGPLCLRPEAIPRLVYFMLEPTAIPDAEECALADIRSFLQPHMHLALPYLTFWRHTLGLLSSSAPPKPNSVNKCETFESCGFLDKIRILRDVFLEHCESSNQEILDADILNDPYYLPFTSAAIPVLLLSCTEDVFHKYLRVLLRCSLATEYLTAFISCHPSLSHLVIAEVLRLDSTAGAELIPHHYRYLQILNELAGIDFNQARTVREVLTREKRLAELCLKLTCERIKDPADYIGACIHDLSSFNDHWILNTKSESQRHYLELIAADLIHQLSGSIRAENVDDLMLPVVKCLRCLSILHFVVAGSQISQFLIDFSEQFVALLDHERLNDLSGTPPKEYRNAYRLLVCSLLGSLCHAGSDFISPLQSCLHRALLLTTRGTDRIPFDPSFQFCLIVASSYNNAAFIERIYTSALDVLPSFSQHFVAKSLPLMKELFKSLNASTCVRKVNRISFSVILTAYLKKTYFV